MLLKTAISLLVALAGCTTPTDHSAPRAHTPAHQPDPPSTHGMLMVGSGPVYLSHLPMFHAPHDYQVLLEVEMVKAGTDPLFTYVQDRQVTGEKVYTVVPETFVLSELFTPANAPQRKTFKADVVRGHFERGGTEFISNVTFKVTRVVFAKKFEANPAALPNLQYLVFGSQKELFAAHIVTKKPDFDHVVSVRISDGILSEAQAQTVEKGVFVRLPGLANKVGEALKAGAADEAEAKVGAQTLPIVLETVESFYLETGDLSF